MELATFVPMQVYGDDYFMRLAMREAQKAADAGEVPIGAVIVSGDQILARGHNSVEMLQDVTAHAEILAITAASQFLSSKYLMECTMFVTLEPCVMCAGALRWSQIGRVIYATPDDKAGFMRYGKELLHPRTQLEMGIMMEESALLLKNFFSGKRKIEK
ncbi:MAG TPA: nucleoside deaminase [Saprospiraceae bacterium]|nr:nucleoside deaminase [Saprospiraceae bacterium]